MGQGSPDTWVHGVDGIRAQNGDLVCDSPDPSGCTHLECNVGKPKLLTVEETPARRMLDVVMELADRWKRAQEKHRQVHSGDHFTAGRMNGYEQAIALLLGSTQQDVRNALLAGVL